MAHSCMNGGDNDISSDTLSLSSPVIRAENISETLCPPCPLHFFLCRFHALYYHRSDILFSGFTFFFSPPALDSCVHVLFARTETKCHRKLKWKVKAESSASFQREPGNKGSLWSSRVTLLSALILGLDQSEPPPLFSMLFSQAWQANCTQFLSQGLAGGPHSNSDLAVVTVTPEYYRKFSWGWFRVTLWLNSGFFNHIFWLLLELAHELMCLVGDGVWMNRND